MEGQIFGSNITLPSIHGLQSDCEEEIILLMKEVDLEFQNKYQALLTELINVRSICRAQKDEIEHLTSVLQPSMEVIQNDNLKEKVKVCCKEIEKLKKENLVLKSENYELQRSVRKLSYYESQLESFRRSFSEQQVENKSLREQLSRIKGEHECLQKNHTRVMNGLASFSQTDGNQELSKANSVSSPSPTEAEITEIADKFLSEENVLCKEFLSKMNQNLEDLSRRLSKEVS